MKRLSPLLIAALLVGCGGSEPSSAEQTSTTSKLSAPSKAEFIAARDKECEETNRKWKRLNDRAQALNEKDSLTAEDWREGAELVDRTVKISRERQEELDALPQPSEDRTTLRKIREAQRDHIGIAARLADAMREQELERIAVLSEESNTLETRTAALSEAYGYKVCNQRP